MNGHKAQVQVAAKYTLATIESIVLVDVTDGLREFYICPGDRLRSDVRERYDQFLSSKGGMRPRNPDSKHSAIYPEQVRKWRNGWSRLV